MGSKRSAGIQVSSSSKPCPDVGGSLIAMTSNKYESVYDQKEFMITFTMIFACNEV